MSKRFHLGQSGQSIALYGITMLALALITFFTISVGVRVREKIKVQASADAASYGMAVTQARAMNLMAWSNRAIVADYVSGLSVVSHESYLNYWEGTLLAQKQQMSWPEGEYGLQCLGCVSGECTCCCEACYSAYKASKIADMWNDKYKDVHKIWHTNGQMLHVGLHVQDAAYVLGALADYAAGEAAFVKYLTIATNAQLTEAAANATDSRMHATGPGRSSAMSPASALNFKGAIQDNTVTKTAAPDWDTYHEILSGTRTAWINRHSQYVPGLPWTEGEIQQIQIAEDCEGTAISPLPTNLGGAMMSKYNGVSDIVDVNTENTHQYNSGSAKGEGGRYAMTAVNQGKTSVMMICEACEPVTYGQQSLAYKDDTRMEGPKGCHNDSFVTAYDGYSDGDSNSGMAHIWSNANGISQITGAACADQGVSVGFFRYLLDKGSSNDEKSESASTLQKDLWNQPYAFAATQLDLGSGRQFPWDFNFGAISGSLLTLNAGQAALGGANTADHSLSGEGFDNTVWRKIGGFSTALTYYHNPDHWAEVPNLWNPFWRAKLEDPTNSQGASGNGKDPARNVSLDITGDDWTVAQAMGY